MIKKLFLMTALGLGIQLCASQHQSDPDTELLNFANYLDRVPTSDPEPKNIATWIREIFYGTNENTADQLKEIVLSTKDNKARAQAIKQIYAQETTPKEENKGYFSNM